MKDSITFKPVLWRLIIWKFIPFYVGWMIAKLTYETIYPNSYSLPALETTLAVLIGTAIAVLLFHRKFEIAIDDGKISGLGAGWFPPRQTFSMAEVDLSHRHEQSFYEKISFYRTIRSLRGQSIIVADFIYGKPLTNELYETIAQDRL